MSLNGSPPRHHGRTAGGLTGGIKTTVVYGTATAVVQYRAVSHVSHRSTVCANCSNSRRYAGNHGFTRRPLSVVPRAGNACSPLRRPPVTLCEINRQRSVRRFVVLHPGGQAIPRQNAARVCASSAGQTRPAVPCSRSATREMSRVHAVTSTGHANSNVPRPVLRHT